MSQNPIVITQYWYRQSSERRHIGAIMSQIRSRHIMESLFMPAPKPTLTHWGRLKHICACKLTIIGSDDGLSLGRRQASIWTNEWILLNGPLGTTNASDMLIIIQTFSFNIMLLKMSSGKSLPFCLGLNVVKPPRYCSFGVESSGDWWTPLTKG